MLTAFQGIVRCAVPSCRTTLLAVSRYWLDSIRLPSDRTKTAGGVGLGTGCAEFDGFISCTPGLAPLFSEAEAVFSIAELILLERPCKPTGGFVAMLEYSTIS